MNECTNAQCPYRRRAVELRSILDAMIAGLNQATLLTPEPDSER